MYEFTHGGLWFDWGKLDAQSKRLAIGSLVCSFVGAIPLGLIAGEFGYRAGYAMASGQPLTYQPMLSAWAAVWMVVFTVLAGVLWWRLSVRQDEMFNRIQNWAIGAGCGWSAVVLIAWAFLAMAKVLPWASPFAVIGVFWVAIMVAWTIACRRWA